MATFELFVGSDAFWQQAKRDIAAAQHRVFIQALTFEADAAGRQVADSIAASKAGDRRILVDDFNRLVINDHFLISPLVPQAVRDEARDTRQMFDTLTQDGVAVRVTNPVAGSLFRYPIRNHKKLIVADNVAYVGGINFSDHNFAWHDMMTRIEGVEEADFFAEDFNGTWQSHPPLLQRRIADTDYIAFNGRDNEEGFKPFFALLANARERIEVVSAYPTFPFVDAFVDAAERGVEVEIHTPAPNNKPIVRDYLLPLCMRAGIKVHLLPDMTHLKAILIDRQTLVLGSCNFNFVSIDGQEEYMMFVRDPDLVAQFVKQVIDPYIAAALPLNENMPPRWRTAAATTLMSIADRFVKRQAQRPRTAVDWPVSS